MQKQLTASQIRAARGLVDWSQEDLSKISGLSVATVRKLELGSISPRGGTNKCIRGAFENAGLEFIEPNGVRQKPEEITVYEGDDGARRFFDDIYETSLRTGQDVIQVWARSQTVFTLLGDYKKFHHQRMMAAVGRFAVKGIITETVDAPPAPFAQARFFSKQLVDSVPFYVYGDKYAIIPLATERDKKIIVIQSRAAAEAFRMQFESMWEKATPIVSP